MFQCMSLGIRNNVRRAYLILKDLPFHKCLCTVSARLWYPSSSFPILLIGSPCIVMGVIFDECEVPQRAARFQSTLRALTSRLEKIQEREEFCWLKRKITGNVSRDEDKQSRHLDSIHAQLPASCVLLHFAHCTAASPRCLDGGKRRKTCEMINEMPKDLILLYICIFFFFLLVKEKKWTSDGSFSCTSMEEHFL